MQRFRRSFAHRFPVVERKLAHVIEATAAGDFRNRFFRRACLQQETAGLIQAPPLEVRHRRLAVGFQEQIAEGAGTHAGRPAQVAQVDSFGQMSRHVGEGVRELRALRPIHVFAFRVVQQDLVRVWLQTPILRASRIRVLSGLRMEHEFVSR